MTVIYRLMKQIKNYYDVKGSCIVGLCNVKFCQLRNKQTSGQRHLE